jgi:hypothetical protein
MKKVLFLTILVLFPFFAFGGEDENVLKLENFQDIKSEGGIENLYSRFMSNWPTDANGKSCAVIRVKFENLTEDEINALNYNFPSSMSIGRKVNYSKETGFVSLFVSPSNNGSMYIDNTKYKSNRISPLKLLSRHVYEITLKSSKKVHVSVKTYPEDLTIKLDNNQTSTSKDGFSDVSVGPHSISVVNEDGTVMTNDVQVTENDVEFDLRPKKNVKFTSSPEGAELYIGKEDKGKLPLTLSLPYGSYDIQAIKSPTEKDRKSVTIDASTKEVNLEPVKKHRFEVIGNLNGNPVATDLYINNVVQKPLAQQRHAVELPYGTYHFKLAASSADANNCKRTVKVNAKQGDEEFFKLQPRNSFVWPWQREYDDAVFGMNAGYVQKQFDTHGDGQKFKENGVWTNGADKSLSGFEIGFHAQPCLNFGLGLYTGLACDMYLSTSDNDDSGYNNYKEIDLYVPVHALFRVPFSKKCALFVHGGLGFTYAVWGCYSVSGDNSSGTDDLSDFWGKEMWTLSDNEGNSWSKYAPKRFNIAAELSLGFRLGPVMVGATYSKGLNNHAMYKDVNENLKTIQNKMAFTISYVINE